MTGHAQSPVIRNSPSPEQEQLCCGPILTRTLAGLPHKRSLRSHDQFVVAILA